MIKQFWLESGGFYGYRKVHTDLCDIGEKCGVNRVYHLLRDEGQRIKVGYRKPRLRNGESHIAVPNRLHQFNTDSQG